MTRGGAREWLKVCNSMMTFAGSHENLKTESKP
jgi:hypothetical protein